MQIQGFPWGSPSCSWMSTMNRECNKLVLYLWLWSWALPNKILQRFQLFVWVHVLICRLWYKVEPCRAAVGGRMYHSSAADDRAVKPATETGWISVLTNFWRAFLPWLCYCVLQVAGLELFKCWMLQQFWDRCMAWLCVFKNLVSHCCRLLVYISFKSTIFLSESRWCDWITEQHVNQLVMDSGQDWAQLLQATWSHIAEAASWVVQCCRSPVWLLETKAGLPAGVMERCLTCLMRC